MQLVNDPRFPQYTKSSCSDTVMQISRGHQAVWKGLLDSRGDIVSWSHQQVFIWMRKTLYRVTNYFEQTNALEINTTSIYSHPTEHSL